MTSVRWYCPTCQIESEGEGGPCAECAGDRALDRRVHEPDLPAMGPHPSDDWVAVWLPADPVEAEEVQEFLEGLGIPALVLPEWAEWAGNAPDDEHALVHVAVPRDRTGEARRALIALLAA